MFVLRVSSTETETSLGDTPVCKRCVFPFFSLRSVTVVGYVSLPPTPLRPYKSRHSHCRPRPHVGHRPPPPVPYLGLVPQLHLDLESEMRCLLPYGDLNNSSLTSSPKEKSSTGTDDTPLSETPVTDIVLCKNRDLFLSTLPG